jgi:hypothetical protein
MSKLIEVETAPLTCVTTMRVVMMLPASCQQRTGACSMNSRLPAGTAAKQRSAAAS